MFFLCISNDVCFFSFSKQISTIIIEYTGFFCDILLKSFFIKWFPSFYLHLWCIYIIWINPQNMFNRNILLNRNPNRSHPRLVAIFGYILPSIHHQIQLHSIFVRFIQIGMLSVTLPFYFFVVSFSFSPCCCFCCCCFLFSFHILHCCCYTPDSSVLTLHIHRNHIGFSSSLWICC